MSARSLAWFSVSILVYFHIVFSRSQIVRRHEQATGEHEADVSPRSSAVHTTPLEVKSNGLLVQVGEGPEQYKGTEFKLDSTTTQDKLRIPRQVVLTGPFRSFAEALQHRSDLTTSIGITPDMSVRYFNNDACRAYLEANDPDLVAFFDAETHGSYRGDLCRTSVLAREGGFYVDLDMQLRVPINKLVDDDTTFMTARAAYGGALNAIIGAVPNSPVMLSTLAHMRKWYHKEILQDGLLGPRTMQLGLEQAMRDNCPEHNWGNAYRQFKCGDQHSFRLFTEQLIGWGDCSNWMATMCPPTRAQSRLAANKFGLFDASPDDPAVGNKGDLRLGATEQTGVQQPSSGQVAAREQRFLGWPRFEGCKELGCGLNGGIASF